MPPKPIPAIDRALALLEDLHKKIDALPKCECASLRQELTELKKTLAPPLPSETYSTVKKAINDASVYAEKSTRAVWIGREECLSPNDTLASDDQAVKDLCAELNDHVISKALADGNILHKRHPEIKGDRKKRPMKLQFDSQKTRDHFLTLIRTSRPPTVTKSGGAFIRRDLCPFELDLERQARFDAWSNNVKIGSLAFGVRDEKMIKFNVINRPLPSGYANRPPRGFENALLVGPPTLSLDTSLNQSNATLPLDNSTLTNPAILTALTPMTTRSSVTAAAATATVATTSSKVRV
ncbi:hypothetical protein DXG03_009530 [Asterophora parasitica]|uniref:Uncharacterized protein n=1 Tax=Asterophora parasitica TaxID=117018 RepID=A0A9P7FZW0_9AGAR|nr:hypothetical protein DXG03_009530 [Asterophora parasitica]